VRFDAQRSIRLFAPQRFAKIAASSRLDTRLEDQEIVTKVRDDIDARKAEHDLHKAQRRADRAEEDARFAIDFAYSAIVEAEYSALDAALARSEANELSGGT
jgi:hypothetical protein